jgi:AraC family transcriptional regulator of adaptative response / DNA-3-methyladenine glycosylase II
MTLDPDSCYRALQAHDRRFDGKFFVGVSSTRIYCRPVCTVRAPRRENCRFFASAAAAEAGGYRPCLRCRPELAPGNAAVDASARLAQAAVNMIENGLMNDGGIEPLAARVGVTSRHLRRIFESEFGVSPVAYAQTQRLLLAKRLLTDTALPVTEIALASGFASVRRFNALFKDRYRMAPSALRRGRTARALPARLGFELAYRPPYDWEWVSGFLASRAIPGVEEVEGGVYRRTLAIVQRGVTHIGAIEVRHVARKHALAIAVSPSLARVTPAVLAQAKHAFDLGCDPNVVAAALGDLAARRPGLRVPGTFDGFEVAVRAVVGQQISVRGARTLLGRIANALGDVVPDAAGGEGPTRLFPPAARVAACDASQLARLGMPRARAETLVGLARAIAAGELVLAPGADVEATVRALEAMPGIGPWTAQYVAMRALAWPDAFPASDLGVLKALGETRTARAASRSEAWRPWRAYAVMHLWSQAT